MDYSKLTITEMKEKMYKREATGEQIFESLLCNFRKKKNKTSLKKVTQYLGSFPQACVLASDHDIQLFNQVRNYK